MCVCVYIRPFALFSVIGRMNVCRPCLVLCGDVAAYAILSFSFIERVS